MKLRSGVGTGAYPERERKRGSWIDRSTARVRVLAHGRWDLRTRYSWMFSGLRKHEAALAGLDDEALRAHGALLAPQLVRRGPSRTLLPATFAWLREMAARSLGERQDDTQCLGAAAMLGGAFAELPRAEDRTLALGLAAATTVCAGASVELVHARPDRAIAAHERLRPFFAALGMSTALVEADASRAEKRAAYACDVTFVAAPQLVLDYLYDRVLLDGRQNRIQLVLERLLRGREARLETLVLGGLRAAFVDDADRVLVDDGQRPLTIADPDRSSELHSARIEALRLARELRLGEDFTLDAVAFEVTLTAEGEASVESASEAVGGVWKRPAWRARMVTVALACLHLWRQGVTHELSGGGFQLLPEGAERLGNDGPEVLPVLGLVEDVMLTPSQDPLRRMSVPRLFQRYQRIAGTGATLREVSGSLFTFYERPVVRVPLLTGAEPTFSARSAFRSVEERDRALTARLRAITDAGEAALVGVREEDGARAWAERLVAEGFDAHAVLAPSGSGPGGQLEDAGASGRVTLIPTRALRDLTVREPERLHVLRLEPLQSRRFDRLLYAHARGSQVEGPLESFGTLDDPVLAESTAQLLRSGLARVAKQNGRLPELLLRPLERRAQARFEGRHQGRLTAALRAEESQEAALAFGGIHH